MNHALIVDDDPTQRFLIAKILKKHLQLNSIEAENGQECLDILGTEAANTIQLIILDLQMPVMDGLEALPKIIDKSPDIPVIVVTGNRDMASTNFAIKNGATDFFLKPVDIDRIIASAQNAIKIHTLNKKVARLEQETHNLTKFSDLIGTSDRLQSAVDQAKKAAHNNINVLITGETGVGKEVFARAIHGESTRAQKPFIAVNCGAIPEKLVESTLFGHEKGAFTGAINKTLGKFREADGGTIFLDEVGELPLDTQVKLLRVLQEQEVEPVGAGQSIKVNVRVIAATNRDLGDQIQSGQFREDLYFRLSVLGIHIPSLRQRETDIPALTEFFITKFAHKHKKAKPDIDKTALKKLMDHQWHGNIRELENTLNRAIILADNGRITEDDIEFYAPRTAPTNHMENRPEKHSIPILDEDGNLHTLEQLEQLFFEKAIKHCGGNMSKTAQELNIAKSTLYRKINNAL